MLHSLACGHKAFFYPASTPVTGPGIVQELKATNAGILYTVPYALKIVSESEGGIEALQKLQAVVYIGSSCPQALGDRLVNAGVVLCSFYGSTECGFLLKYASLELWNWLQIVEDAKPYVMFEPRGENTFEMVVAKGWKSLVDSNRPDGSFATKDLLLRHPEFPNLYKYLQRSDDTIVLSNGEKTNPIFLENSIRQNRYVEAAIVFGAERPSLGVIVIPSSYAIGLSSEEIIENIWPDVTKGNDVSPAYARIYKDAILVKEPNALFPKTDKGTVIRPAFIKQFQADIDAYYARLDEVTEFTGEDLTEPEIRQLVRSIVAKELQIDETTLADDADFFNMSLDSLMAISARTKLSKLVNTRGVPLSSNIVFDRPNVTALTEHLFGLSTGNGEKEEVPVEERMAAMVKKYSTFKRHVFSNGSIRGDYVVLTGSTGSLGAQILSILVQRPKILGVYCFVRANDQSSAQSRVLDSLRQGQLLPTLSPSHLTKIHALPADLSAPDFGLPQETLDEVTTRVTTVIHSAWSVNFNSTLESFEKHHIRGTHNLLNLCLSTPRRLPATFSFISSISTSLNRGTPTIPESLPDFSHAMNMGYGQSKLVAEHIVATADKKPSMMTRILRVGQIVGDTKHGQWNPKEATPLTVQSARTIGALPVIANGDEALSWLPLDVTANTVVDLALADTPSKQRVFNVCHPKVLYWNRDFLPALKEAGLDFEAVEQHEWLRRLEASEQNGEKNPSIKLLGFFQNKYSGDAAVQEPYFETTETCKCSKSLREAKEVDSALIKKFVRFWQEECW